MALDPAGPVTRFSVKVWDIESGLPSNSIYTVLQTQDGYLWIGTQDGLVRFDGVRFELFNHARTPRLLSDVIRALYEDPNGTLWIGTESGGLTAYKDGEFTTYPAETHRALDRIRAIHGDRWGNVWIGSSTRGLTSFHNGQFTTYTTSEGLPHNQVKSIYRDDNKDLWIVTAGGIIKCLEPGVFQVHAPQMVLPHFKTACVYDNQTRELWIGTGSKGLFRLKKEGVASYGTREGLPSHIVNTLYKDRMNSLWIGTDGGGLTRVLLDGMQMSTLSRDNGLADGSVYAIYEDSEDSLWVGTLDGGLHQLRDNIFTTYTTREGLADDYTGCIVEDREGNTWIGTKKGLSRMSGGVFVSPLTTRDGLLNNAVSSLLEDSLGRLWIGTMGGLHKFQHGKLTPLTREDGLSDNKITCLLGDKQGNVWVGTENGLNRIDNTGGAITQFSSADGLSGKRIEFLFEDSKGRIWIGAETGLNYLENGNTGIYTPPPGIKINLFHCALEDNGGVHWFGTSSGLLRLKDGETTLYTVQNGLVDNQVYSLLEDRGGYLWLAGRSGISRLGKQELEAVAREKTGLLHPDWYNETDGMKSRWCTGAGVQTRDGRFWFPTSAGAAVIDPNRITQNTPPPPLIEKLAVDGESFIIKSLTGSGDTLQLAPGKKRLEFYYTAVTFVSPQKLSFKIKLDGYDSDWVDMKNLRTATYTGLQPGNYTFRVTAGSAGGTWNGNQASFPFYLKPYIYQTTWFYITALLLIAAGAFLLHHYRVGKLRARKKELKRLVEMRTRDLEERNEELEKTRLNVQRSKELIEAKNQQLEEQADKLKELDNAKSRFFANISHEFRTPLTLIKGPLEQILANSPDKDLESKAHMMLRNSNRLLSLVDQLLELAKFDSGQMKLRAAQQNIVPFVKNIVMCFESLAQQNKVKLSFQGEADEISLYFDPEKMERILINLLANAFNHTPGGGKIAVSLRKTGAAALPGVVEISVRDTGTGIPAGQLPHIFNRFYRGESSYEYKSKGTGIGLALVRELVELHHGEIDVESSCQPDHTRGTEFILRLPLGKKHLKMEEIGDSPGDAAQRTPSIDIPARGRQGDNTNSAQTGPGDDKPIILVVDDNGDVRSYIRSALEPHFNILEAANGREGIDKAGEIIPDLVISDIMMPEVDGCELCTHLKKDIKTSHIPVILLTARASEKSMAEGLETGADDYITKPFNADILVIRVKNLIRLRRHLQQKFQKNMTLQPGEVSVSSMDEEFMNELRTIIDTNLSNPEFTIDQLCKELCMSPNTLRRKLEALTGETPTRLLRSYRLTRAVQLLEADFGNITEVAFAVGFSSASYFTKCFKEKFNRVPRSYQAPDSN
jgi:ligand-binding sensor domain-containing protein/signal transduction histidine kinase/DNA-binding response OmpR family regulator